MTWWPSFWPNMTIFELGLDIVKTNIPTKFQKKSYHKCGLYGVNIKCWRTTHDGRRTTHDDGRRTTTDHNYLTMSTSCSGELKKSIFPLHNASLTWHALIIRAKILTSFQLRFTPSFPDVSKVENHTTLLIYIWK